MENVKSILKLVRMTNPSLPLFLLIPLWCDEQSFASNKQQGTEKEEHLVLSSKLTEEIFRRGDIEKVVKDQEVCGQISLVLEALSKKVTLKVNETRLSSLLFSLADTLQQSPKGISYYYHHNSFSFGRCSCLADSFFSSACQR